MIAGRGRQRLACRFGEDGVIVVDSGTKANATAVLAAIKKISTAPIRYVINTTFDADHVGGNETISKGRADAARHARHRDCRAAAHPFFGSEIAPASILSLEGVLARMSAATGQAAYPDRCAADRDVRRRLPEHVSQR
jgi:glyoxylase-like metal-dependent hydrolase (beta-lactamase superfamily II)